MLGVFLPTLEDAIPGAWGTAEPTGALATFNHSGAAVANAHTVIDTGLTAMISPGVFSLTVTFTGNAVFSSIGSYSCTAEDITHTGAVVGVANL